MSSIARRILKKRVVVGRDDFRNSKAGKQRVGEAVSIGRNSFADGLGKLSSIRDSVAGPFEAIPNQSGLVNGRELF